MCRKAIDCAGFRKEKIMSDVTRLNEFLRSVSRPDFESVAGRLLLTERQEKVLDMYFVKRKDVGFIADALFISPRVIRREIHRIRSRILREIEKKQALYSGKNTRQGQ